MTKRRTGEKASSEVYKKRDSSPKTPTTSADEASTPSTSSAEQDETYKPAPVKSEIRKGNVNPRVLREQREVERITNELEYPSKSEDDEYFSLDVECAATGRGHDDLSPCRISLVNVKQEVLLDVVINTKNLYSPLTPLTGLTIEEIEQGISLELGLKRLHALLHDKVVLVGQLIDQDCSWCQLVQGIHYKRVIDLSELTKLWQHSLHRYLYFSLDRAAYALLNIQSEYPHCPVRDATMSIRIFNEWCNSPEQLQIARNVLRNASELKLFPRRKKPKLPDDVCIGKFNRKLCTCHQKQTCY